jgi:hypothetical protein
VIDLRDPTDAAAGNRLSYERRNEFVTNRHLHFILRRINGPAEREIRPDKDDEDIPEPRHNAQYISYIGTESNDYGKSVTLSLYTVSCIVGKKLNVVYQKAVGISRTRLR